MSKAAAASVVYQVPPPFAPPPVEVGQVVLWTYGTGDRPTPALVLKVATGSLTLAVHVDGIKDHVLKTGVRHVDDPLLKTRPASDQGVWDLSPRDKRIDALLESLGSADGEE